jgi:hypothetical protein
LGGERALESPDFRKRPDSALPIRFFALGLVGLLLLNAGIALDPGAVRWPLPAHGILLLHLTVLGWITPVMMGADYQLIPVVLHRPLRSQRVAGFVLWLYAAGVAVFLFGWAIGRPLLVAAGGTLAGCALLLFCVHAGSALVRVERWGPTALGLGGGIGFLALTGVAGPYMAISIDGAMPAGAFATFRAVHAAAGLSGWLLLTIMGATYELLPFFAATGPGVRPRFGTAAVACTAAGTLLLLVSGIDPAVSPAAGLVVVGSGVAGWIHDLIRLAHHGRQARREPVVRYSLAAALAIGVGGGVAASAWGANSLRLAMAGAVLGLLAGPSLLILGQLQKILPFLAALDAALAAKRQGRVPKTEALFPRERAFAILWALAPGFAAEIAGVATASMPVLRIGALVTFTAAAVHAVQQARSLAVWRAVRYAPLSYTGRASK